MVENDHLLTWKRLKTLQEKYTLMSDVQKYIFSESDADQIVQFARDTLEIYTKEGQKMDVGSVNDLLNMKAGIFVEIESTGSFNRVRGNAGSFDSQQLASSIINATVYAASNRSLGSEISRTELSNVRFKIAPIEEIRVTDDPIEEIEIGKEVPLFLEGENGWIYPTDPEQYNWSIEEYLDRTCKKCDLRPDYWKDGYTLIARTRPIVEESPGGSINIL